ncbi:UDP-N-acetylglucosamine transferase subunit ALG14 [Schistosoma japonicum]|nr:UDP-N-acetylglucosamine transferase subunit ALG14 [Schistosoma japonicum]
MLILYFILGGHTAEMLSYVSVLTPKYQPRTYVIAATDSISEQKVFNLEDKSDIKFSVKRIRRAREVKQSYVSNAKTSFNSYNFCRKYLSYQDIIVIWEDIIPYTLGGCDCSMARIENKISKINLLGTFVVDARMQLCDINCIQKNFLSVMGLLLFCAIVVRNLK